MFFTYLSNILMSCCKLSSTKPARTYRGRSKLRGRRALWQCSLPNRWESAPTFNPAAKPHNVPGGLVEVLSFAGLRSFATASVQRAMPGRRCGSTWPRTRACHGSIDVLGHAASITTKPHVLPLSGFSLAQLVRRPAGGPVVCRRPGQARTA